MIKRYNYEIRNYIIENVSTNIRNNSFEEKYYEKVKKIEVKIIETILKYYIKKNHGRFCIC